MINRRIEYYSAIAMLSWSALLFATDHNSVNTSEAFRPLLERGWTPPQLAGTLGAFGVVWMVALWINGHYRRTPVFRCICAGAGTVMWSHIAIMLTISGLDTDVWPEALALYWPLAFFDLASCYRSAADAYFAHLKGKIKDMAAAQHEP